LLYRFHGLAQNLAIRNNLFMSNEHEYIKH
jgi:hypothetical protein